MPTYVTFWLCLKSFILEYILSPIDRLSQIQSNISELIRGSPKKLTCMELLQLILEKHKQKLYKNYFFFF